MTINKTVRSLSVAAVFSMIAAGTQAVVLLPGDLSTPLPGTALMAIPSLSGGTLIDSQDKAFLTDYWAGNLRSAVIRETTGKLTFLYQLQITAGGLHNVTRLTTIDFTGFSSDVDYLSDTSGVFGFTSPVSVPSNPFFADRQSADVVGFGFRNGKDISGLTVGQTTNVMYIRTNATGYTSGYANVIDGRTAEVTSFSPTSSVPGPAALIPFGMGLVTAFGRKRRR